MKLWSETDKIDLSMAVLVVLANGGGIVSFPGCDSFKVDGDGELTATMAGGVAGVVARGMWIYVYRRHEPGKETAVVEPKGV
jgi:hypothetical protein